MKTLRLVILLLMPLLVSTGCYLTTSNTNIMSDEEFDRELLKAMKTWEGHHISSVVQRFGPPTEKVSDEAGGTIYIWKIDPQSLPPIAPSPYFTPPRSQSETYGFNHALTQATGRLIYQQNVNKSRQHRHEMNKFRQRMLAMKRMFFVRSNGTIYLAHLTYQ